MRFWQPKLRTAAAMARLCWARLLIAWIPFKYWRHTLGLSAERGDQPDCAGTARRFAADVEWAAKRLPLSTKCLPRAMTLSWMLRRLNLGHTVVIAIRTPGLRQLPDALHAWVEVEGEMVLGDLPGPWIETMRLGD